MVPDVHERLSWYRRLSTAQSPGAVDEVLEELELERGAIPTELDNLAGMMILQLHGREIGITRIAWLKVRALLTFHPGTTVPRARLDNLVKKAPKRFTVRQRGDDPVELEVRFSPKEAERPFRFLRWVVGQIRRGT